MLLRSSSDKPLLSLIVTEVSILVDKSLAETTIIPSASIINEISICGIPLGAF
jgi:hypothetical protein